MLNLDVQALPYPTSAVVLESRSPRNMRVPLAQPRPFSRSKICPPRGVEVSKKCSTDR